VAEVGADPAVERIVLNRTRKQAVLTPNKVFIRGPKINLNAKCDESDEL
jgi:hypothetical protein